MSRNIVMAFSPRNIVGYLLKKGLQSGGSRAPQDPPLQLQIHSSHLNAVAKIPPPIAPLSVTTAALKIRIKNCC